MSRVHNVKRSFGFALSGINEAFKNEPNFRIHTLVAFGVLLAGIWLGLNYLEWLLLVFTIAFVLILEMINTSLEKIVDLVSPEKKGAAKVAKDVSAAAVLVAATVATMVGLVLFLPKLF